MGGDNFLIKQHLMKRTINFFSINGLHITIIFGAHACLLINRLEEEMVHTSTYILGQKSIIKSET